MLTPYRQTLLNLNGDAIIEISMQVHALIAHLGHEVSIKVSTIYLITVKQSHEIGPSESG